MLTHVRMLLDESSASFWGDSDIYLALTNGQKAVASVLIQKKSPLADKLRKQATAAYGTDWLNVPSDYWSVISVTYRNLIIGNYVACRERTGDIFVKQGNPYLAGSIEDPFFYVANGALVFEPTTTTSSAYKMLYYKLPTDISGSTEPTLNAATHDAICQYAFAELLLRDTKHQESALEFKKFTDMVSIL